MPTFKNDDRPTVEEKISKTQKNSGRRLGVSTCLLGEKVRYDGGHKMDRFTRDLVHGS
jgi:hypothetical protein